MNDCGIEQELDPVTKKYALPNCLPMGPYNLLPGAATAALADDGDRHGCLAWLARRDAGTVAYVSFGTVAKLPPDELRELASGLEDSGAPTPGSSCRGRRRPPCCGTRLWVRSSRTPAGGLSPRAWPAACPWPAARSSATS
jgi:hypothetical protein